MDTNYPTIQTNDLESDQRRIKFFSYYFATDKDTYLDPYKSAIESGFSRDEAQVVEHEVWFIQNIGKGRRDKIFNNAENFLLELTELDTLDEEGRQDSKLLGVKLKGVLAALEGLGKDHYSKRIEENKTNVNVNLFKVLNEIEESNNESHKSLDDKTVIFDI